MRRHLCWLAGLSFALACSVNNSNLDLDASTCPRCVGSGGTVATGGQPGAGGATATGGQIGTGGDGQSGGTIGTGGGQSGGATGTGGSGQSGGATGTGGNGQSGGATGTGGNTGTGGQGGETCSMLANDYANALTTAKKCFAGAPNQCQQLVDDTIGCSNCREYVNDATTLNMLERQWTNQGCANGHICSTISCVAPPTSCVASNSSGPGPGTGAGMCENSLVGTTGP